MDGLCTRFLKVLANLLTQPLKNTFEKSKNMGGKEDWKGTNAVLIIFKS